MSPLLAFSACWVWPDWLLDVADAECAGFDESQDRPEIGHILGLPVQILGHTEVLVVSRDAQDSARCPMSDSHNGSAAWHALPQSRRVRRSRDRFSQTEDQSGRDAVVVSEQAAEALLAPDLMRVCERAFRRRAGSGQRHVALRLVGPQRVVVVGVLADQVGHVAQAEDQEVIEALVLNGLRPALGAGVEVRRDRGEALDQHTFVGEHLIDATGELSVAVTDQDLRREPDGDRLVAEEFRLLVNPRRIWVTGGRRYDHAPCLQVDEEEEVGEP